MDQIPSYLKMHHIDLHFGLKWTNNFVKCLGIWMRTHMTEVVVNINSNERINKHENLLNIQMCKKGGFGWPMPVAFLSNVLFIGKNCKIMFCCRDICMITWSKIVYLPVVFIFYLFFVQTNYQQKMTFYFDGVRLNTKHEVDDTSLPQLINITTAHLYKCLFNNQ